MWSVLSCLAVAISLTGNILVNNRWKSGYFFWIASNVSWITVNLFTYRNYPQLLLYLLYIGLSIHGYLKWRRAELQQQRQLSSDC